MCVHRKCWRHCARQRTWQSRFARSSSVASSVDSECGHISRSKESLPMIISYRGWPAICSNPTRSRTTEITTPAMTEFSEPCDSARWDRLLSSPSGSFHLRSSTTGRRKRFFHLAQQHTLNTGSSNSSDGGVAILSDFETISPSSVDPAAPAKSPTHASALPPSVHSSLLHIRCFQGQNWSSVPGFSSAPSLTFHL